MSINLRKLTSISVQLAQQASKIVKESFANKQVKKFMKSQHDPVTEADFKIQTLIINGIKEYYPELKIVGQEEVEYKGIIDFNYKSMSEEYLPKNFKLNRECPIEDLCVWIDPIDGTLGFVENRIEDVSVLIGISEKKKASIGVVGIPFTKQSSQASYRPSISVGAVQAKSAFSFNFNPQNQKGQWGEIHPNFSLRNRRIVMSNNWKPDDENKVIKDLKAEKMLHGGSGKKIMMVAKNQAQMMLYMKQFTSKWDSCAGQAIIKSMGGYFSTPFGEELEYDEENKQMENMDGFFCTLNEQLYKETINLCNKKYKKKSDSMV